MGRRDFETETLIPVTGGFFDHATHALKAEGADASEDGTGRGTPLVFGWNRSAAQGMDVSETTVDPLRATAQNQPAIAFQCQGSNVGVMGHLRRGNGNESGGVPFVVNTTHITSKANGHNPKPGNPSPCLERRGESPLLLTGGVRRLTPLECERLQGFPDGWTAIEYKGKSAKDSPRYKAIGNSMAVPVLAWIGRRIELVERVIKESGVTA